MGKNQLLGASKTFSCQVDKSSSIYLYLYTKIHIHIHIDLFQFMARWTSHQVSSKLLGNHTFYVFFIMT